MSFLAELYRLFFIFIFSFTLRSPFFFFFDFFILCQPFFFPLISFTHTRIFVYIYIFVYVCMYKEREECLMSLV